MVILCVEARYLIYERFQCHRNMFNCSVTETCLIAFTDVKVKGCHSSCEILGQWRKMYCPDCILKLFFFICSSITRDGCFTACRNTFSTLWQRTRQQILLQQECIPVGCVPSAAVAVGGGSASVYPGGVSAQVHAGIRPPCEQNDRRLWKHNLAATTLWTVIMKRKLIWIKQISEKL